MFAFKCVKVKTCLYIHDYRLKIRKIRYENYYFIGPLNVYTGCMKNRAQLIVNDPQ